VILESLLGDGSGGLKILIAVVVVLVLLALAFWLARRFGGGRLGSAATRGRQPRLAVIDQATVDGRRRLVLIRRDNVEHLLIIGGPTDVVVEQNILRAAALQRDIAAVRPAAAPDALPRAVPLGDDTSWPLQPEPSLKPEPAKAEPALKTEPAAKVEPAARLEPTLRGDGPPRPPGPATTAEEPATWSVTPETPEPPVAPPAPPAAPVPFPAAAARDRRPAALDPLAGLAEELSRLPSAAEGGAAEQRQPPRRSPRLPPIPPATAGSPEAAAPSADPNLSEMAQRLEAALRRPPKPGEKPADKPGEPTPPTAPEADPFAPRPRPSRLESVLRRPLKPDDLRAAPFPRPGSEPGAADSEPTFPGPRFEPRRPFKADEPRPAALGPGAAPKPADKPAEEPATGESTEQPPSAAQPDPGGKPKSLYDSLEQEMASLLNRPPPKP
jgi:flagellar protein FliO/FliZ